MKIYENDIIKTYYKHATIQVVHNMVSFEIVRTDDLRLRPSHLRVCKTITIVLSNNRVYVSFVREIIVQSCSLRTIHAFI